MPDPDAVLSELSDHDFWELVRSLNNRRTSSVRRTRVCPICGSVFEVPRRMGGPANAIRYCTAMCSREARIRKRRLVNEHFKLQRAEARSGKNCKFCGQPFTPRRSDAVFCRDTHRVLSWRKSRQAS